MVRKQSQDQIFRRKSKVDKAPRLVFILIVFVKFNQTANTGTAMLSSQKLPQQTFSEGDGARDAIKVDWKLKLGKQE